MALMRSVFRSLTVALLLLWGPAPGLADSPPIPPLPDGLTLGETARVATVIKGDSVLLEDGRQVRLVGMQAPAMALGRPGLEDWPLAGEAQATLEALVAGRAVVLAYGETRTDRHGRVLAHLIRAEDGLWLQGAMLAAGMARVYSFPDNRRAVREMLALEAAARQAGRGLWGHPFYAVRDAEALARSRERDGFLLVEGTVVAADAVRGRVFLNFGADWRQDFAVSIAPAAMRRFDEAGIDPLAWPGRRVRVRGWVREYRGPRIDVTHPEQIELLETLQ